MQTNKDSFTICTCSFGDYIGSLTAPVLPLQLTVELLVDRVWKHSENASYSHFLSPAHGISVVPYKPAQMVHYIWDAALLPHLVQNPVLLLSSRGTRKWIVWGGWGCVIPAPSLTLKASVLKK